MRVLKVTGAFIAAGLVASVAVRRKLRQQVSSPRASVELDRRLAGIQGSAQQQLAAAQSQCLSDLASFAMEVAGSNPEAQYVVAKTLAAMSESFASQRQEWT